MPAGTRALTAETSTRARGSALVDRRRLEGLEPYREALVDFLGTEARTIKRYHQLYAKDQGVALPAGMTYVGALRLLGFVVTIPPNGGGGTVRNPKAPPKAAAVVWSATVHGFCVNCVFTRSILKIRHLTQNPELRFYKKRRR